MDGAKARKDNETAIGDTSKNMKIMDNQEAGQGIFGHPLEESEAFWEWVDNVDTSMEAPNRNKTNLNKTMTQRRRGVPAFDEWLPRNIAPNFRIKEC